MHLTDLARKFSTKRSNSTSPPRYKISAPISQDEKNEPSRGTSITPPASEGRSQVHRSPKPQGRNPLSPKILPEKISRKISQMIPKRGAVSDLPTISLQSIYVDTLTYILAQPISTPLLTTKIAELGPPLGRATCTAWPKDLCNVHTWLNVEWLTQLKELIGNELGYYLKRLWALPQEFLGQETRRYLYETLWPYRILAAVNADTPVPGANYDVGRYDDGSDQTQACEEISCIACNLSMLFQNANAIEALATCAKSRKRHKGPWPQILAWLEPIDERKDPGWRRRWLHEGRAVRADRRKARMWKDCGDPVSERGSDVNVKQEFEKAIHRAVEEEHLAEEEELERAIQEEELIAEYSEEAKRPEEETTPETDSTRPMQPEDFLISGGNLHGTGDSSADTEIYRPAINTENHFRSYVDEETGEVVRGAFDKYQSIACLLEQDSGKLTGDSEEQPQTKERVAKARATAFQDLHQKRTPPSLAEYARWQWDNPKISRRHGKDPQAHLIYNVFA